MHAAVGAQNPCIICIVESWIYRDIPEHEISIEGYQIVRLDCDRHVGSAIKPNLTMKYCLGD